MKNMCQSCGMPLKDAVRGSRKNGDLSQLYCKYCFQDGEFTVPDATVDDMVKYSVEGMTKKGWPKFMAKFLTKNTKNLPRWKQEDTSKPAQN